MKNVFVFFRPDASDSGKGLVLFALLLRRAQLLPVALEAEDVVLERVALAALHARVQEHAAVLKFAQASLKYVRLV